MNKGQVYPYNGILSNNNKNKWHFDICWKHCGKQKENWRQIIYTLWFHSYEMPRTGIHRDRKQIGGCQELREKGMKSDNKGSKTKGSNGCKPQWIYLKPLTYVLNRWVLWHVSQWSCNEMSCYLNTVIKNT